MDVGMIDTEPGRDNMLVTVVIGLTHSPWLPGEIQERAFRDKQFEPRVGAIMKLPSEYKTVSQGALDDALQESCNKD